MIDSPNFTLSEQSIILIHANSRRLKIDRQKLKFIGLDKDKIREIAPEKRREILFRFYNINTYVNPNI